MRSRRKKGRKKKRGKTTEKVRLSKSWQSQKKGMERVQKKKQNKNTKKELSQRSWGPKFKRKLPEESFSRDSSERGKKGKRWEGDALEIWFIPGDPVLKGRKKSLEKVKLPALKNLKERGGEKKKRGK